MGVFPASACGDGGIGEGGGIGGRGGGEWWLVASFPRE